MDNRHSKHHLRDMGEPSSTRRPRPTSDSSNHEHDRPFKKARYVWQLKGKYHLKAASSMQSPSRYARNNNNRPHHNYRMNMRHHTANSSNSSDTDSDGENRSRKKFNDSDVVNTFLIRSNSLLNDDPFYEEEHCTNIDKAISDDIPVTLVTPNSRSQDEYLEQWQARQMAKSHVDNTINSLLELWKLAPFDASDLVENCENDEQVEDEGILMAIQSHGLQTGMIAPAASTSHMGAASRPQEAHVLKQSRNVPDSGDSGDSDDHFLSTAVSVAIQKKGLSSYNYG